MTDDMKLLECRTESEIKAIQFFRDIMKEPFDEETLKETKIGKMIVLEI